MTTPRYANGCVPGKVCRCPREFPRCQAVQSDREKLVAAHVTLNGEPAKITGTRHPFARVTQIKSGLSCEWAWETVARIVAKGGAFTS